MSQPIFSIGEFARLCGVKKDTLFHYDQIGLLKPDRVAANGYRYYTIQQYFTFQIIAALREVGMPLREIRRYLDSQSASTLLPLLEEQQNQLSRQRRHLEQLEQLLRSTAASLRVGAAHRAGELFLERQPAMTLVVMPACTDPADKEYQKNLQDHIRRCRQGGSPNHLSLGGLVPYDNLVRGIWQESLFWTPAGPACGPDCLYGKPEGLYAVYYHQGGYDSLPQAYQTLCRRVREMGYQPAGDLFEEDLLNFLSQADQASYLLKLNLLVRPDPSFPRPWQRQSL